MIIKKSGYVGVAYLLYNMMFMLFKSSTGVTSRTRNAYTSGV
jgi:hypothetical protein